MGLLCMAQVCVTGHPPTHMCRFGFGCAHVCVVVVVGGGAMYGPCWDCMLHTAFYT